MFKCKAKFCLCSRVAHCHNYLSVAPPGKQNVHKNFRRIAEDCRSLCDLVLYAEHVPMQIWPAVARGPFQSIIWSWHVSRRIHLIYQQFVYADSLERASSNWPYVFSQERVKVVCCLSGIWQSNYDQHSKCYSTYRSIPGIFRVTNLQNRRPFWMGGLTLCRGHSRHILFTDVSFLIKTAGGDLMSQHYHTKLIEKKLPPGGHHKGLQYDLMDEGSKKPSENRYARFLILLASDSDCKESAIISTWYFLSEYPRLVNSSVTKIKVY